jgi:hypothetical protein
MIGDRRKRLVVATRLHLGRASSPPSDDSIYQLLMNLSVMLQDLDDDSSALVAVDATPKLENYDYVQVVSSVLERVDSAVKANRKGKIHILPVTPWGIFVPALNALLLHAKSQLEADLIMFVSAEVRISSSSIRSLCDHVTTDYDTVIAAGAALNGHLYSSVGQIVSLTGRTTPWNTLCVWNLDKLSMVGFASISDLGASAGVEECVAIALLQKLFPHGSIAKLVKLEEVTWEERFDDDERRKWHDEKMKSKLERAARQMELLNISGTVLHC